MTALSSVQTALEELHLTTTGYAAAKRANPAAFSKTHNGRCEAALLDAISMLTPPPVVDPPPPVGTAWKWDATQATADPQSAALVAKIQFTRAQLVTNAWAVATAVAAPSDPSYHVPCVNGGTLDQTVRIPLGTLPDPGQPNGDNHLTVLDGGREHEFWQPTYDPAATRRIVSCNGGSSFPTGSLQEGRGYAGNAACFAMRAALIRPEEIKAGLIDHALHFEMPAVGSGAPRYPALQNAGQTPGRLVEGSWLRLPAFVGMAGLKAWEVTVAHALQAHGMFLRDGSGAFCIIGENPINRGGRQVWADAGLSTADNEPFSPAFVALLSRLELLVPPAVIA